MEFVNEVANLSWRAYPAMALLALGLFTAYYGLRLLTASLRRARTNPSEMQGFMRGFRIGIVGLTVAGLGAAWNWNLTWLFVLALVFGAEEFVESTTHLSILRGKHPRRSISSSHTLA